MFAISIFQPLKPETMATSIDQKIVPNVWLDNEAEEAARFYSDVFPNSKVGHITHYVKEGYEIHGRPEGSVMTADVEIDGYRISFLNGGPQFKVNPSISFFVTYESEKDIDAIWYKLSDKGFALMPLDKYPWSEKYGWVQDQYGVTWQVCKGNRNDVGGQSVVPSLLFVKEHYGQAEEALKFYTSIFKNSSVTGIQKYGANEQPDKEGAVRHAQFALNGQTIMVMDSGHAHNFTFNEGISLMVYCKDQQEIDYYWEKLSDGGDPKAQACGWLKDKFGVSWQIVPEVMDEMMQVSDRDKLTRVTRAFLKMKKLDIKALEREFEGV
jgi:predicted 3-demethylubiquinone-9 3-methyltransferase (glyoxalase superfamily)